MNLVFVICVMTMDNDDYVYVSLSVDWLVVNDRDGTTMKHTKHNTQNLYTQIPYFGEFCPCSVDSEKFRCS